MKHKPGDTVFIERQDESGPFLEAYEVLAATLKMLTLKHLWTERQTEKGTERVAGLVTIDITDPQEIEALARPLDIRWNK